MQEEKLRDGVVGVVVVVVLLLVVEVEVGEVGEGMCRRAATGWCDVPLAAAPH